MPWTGGAGDGSGGGTTDNTTDTRIPYKNVDEFDDSPLYYDSSVPKVVSDVLLEVPGGTIAIGETTDLSSSSGDLIVTDQIKDEVKYVITSEFDDTGASQPNFFNLGAASSLGVQTDFSQTLTTNPLTWSITGTVTPPEIRQINSSTFKTGGVMTNVRAKFTDNATGHVVRYIPDKATWDAGTGGLTLVSGDNKFDFISTAADSPGVFNLGVNPFEIENGQQLDTEIRADAINVLGDISGDPYQLVDKQDGTYDDLLSTGSSINAGGSDTEIQYNNSGTLDGISSITTDGTNLALADNVEFTMGASDDFKITHASSISTTVINLDSNVWAFQASGTSLDYRLASTDATTYIKFENGSQSEIMRIGGDRVIDIPDDVTLSIGDVDDFTIKHDGSDTTFAINTGDMIIDNVNSGSRTRITSAPENIQLHLHKDSVLEDGTATAGMLFGVDSETGSRQKGAMFFQRNATYGRGDFVFAINNDANVSDVTIDDEILRINKTGGVSLPDDVNLYLGNSGDLLLQHASAVGNSFIVSFTGDLGIYNQNSTGDTIFQINSLTTATNFTIKDQGNSTLFNVDGSGVTNIPDNRTLAFGNGNDFTIKHDTTNNLFTAVAGDVTWDIQGATEDFEIVFGSDTQNSEFIILNNSESAIFEVKGDGSVHLNDNVSFIMGVGNDFTIVHDGSNTTATSLTGNFTLDNTAATGSTIIQLGTDTSATDFIVKNNSGDDLLKVDGGNTVTMKSQVGGTSTLQFTNSSDSNKGSLSFNQSSDLFKLIAEDTLYLETGDGVTTILSEAGNNYVEIVNPVATGTAGFLLYDFLLANKAEFTYDGTNDVMDIKTGSGVDLDINAGSGADINLELTSSSQQINLIGLAHTPTTPIVTIESQGLLGAKTEFYAGTGDPEGVVTAIGGRVYYRVDGVNSGLYIKKSATSTNADWLDVSSGTHGPSTTVSGSLAYFDDTTGDSVNDAALILVNDPAKGILEMYSDGVSGTAGFTFYDSTDAEQAVIEYDQGNDRLLIDTDTGIDLVLTSGASANMGFDKEAPVSDFHFLVTTSTTDNTVGTTFEQSGTGDAVVHYLLSGSGEVFSVGLDNSAIDSFMISNAYDLGTDTILRVTPAGNITFDTRGTAEDFEIVLGSDTEASEFIILNDSEETIFEVFGDSTVRVYDNVPLGFGIDDDFTITHNSTNTIMTSETGNLIFDNINTTGLTSFILGTDTDATTFEIVNNSQAVLFDVDGAGAVNIPGSLTVNGSPVVPYAHGDNVYEIFSVDDFPNAPSGGEIDLPTGLYIIKQAFSHSNKFVNSDEDAVIEWRSEDKENHTMTSTLASDTLFDFVFSSDGRFKIEHASFILSGNSVTLVDMEGGNSKWNDFRFTFSGTGSIFGEFHDNAEDGGTYELVDGTTTGFQTGVTFDNVGGCQTLNSIYVTDFTGSGAIISVKTSSQLACNLSDCVFVGSGSQANYYIDPVITRQADVINNDTAAATDFFLSGNTGSITLFADASITGQAISSVTDSSGVARFNWTPGAVVYANQEVVISGYTTNTDYNGTFIITTVGSGFFEVSSITFGSNEATGSFDSDSVTVTSATHGQSNGQTLLITDTIEYNAGYKIYNSQTNTFRINAEWDTAETTGTWDTGSLTETSKYVLCRWNGAQRDSHILPSINVADNATTTSTTTSWGAVAFGTAGSAIDVGASNENFTLLNDVTGLLRYDGLNPITIKMTPSISVTKSGGDVEHQFRLFKTVGTPAFDSHTVKRSIGGSVGAASLNCSAVLNPGDEFRPEIKATSSASTITVTDFSL